MEVNPVGLRRARGRVSIPNSRTLGKTLRATSTETHPVHLPSCYDVTTGTVLWHDNVVEKENEMSALKPRLSPLPPLVTARIFTLDAMHTQRELYAN